jgi:uncharacterized membrane protein YkoI
MKLNLTFALGIGLALLTACGSSTGPDTDSLRAALNQAKMSLARSAEVGQESVPDGVAIKAALIAESKPVFSVGAAGGGTMHDVRIDALNGAVLSNTQVGAGSDPCPGSIPLPDAIARAEARIGGVAVQVQPDDDNECYREVLVLGDNDQVWEVKVAQDGAILEVEEADSDD